MLVPPMLLETSQYPFTHPDYIFEPKIDGHRLLLDRRDGVTQLYTRHRNNCTLQYPELYDLAVDDILLDGEVACVDRTTGRIDFECVMDRFQARRADKVLRLSATQPAHYVVFDILRYRGQDLRGWPLLKRKELLTSIDFGNPRMNVVPYIEREGEQLFTEIVAHQLEGMVAKRKESVYSAGRRSASWQKIINWSYAEVAISGWKKAEFGWLASVQEPGGQDRHAGIIELGVAPAQKQAFYSVIEPFITGEDRDHVYVEPRIRAKVKMRNWTRKGLLRSPVFIKFLVDA
ncbi:ATP-dependent DNA ligase [Paenibacillus sp. HJGM_3]|uniref:ATP-dependent DNA ligase n=1 Tax=Paenibacillus sp. HJGM_3 TaxID=3379816 RepID=UPI00385939D9